MVGLTAWPFCSAGALWLGASPSDKGGSAGTAPFKRSEDMVQEDLTKAKAALKQEFNSFHKAFVRFCLIGLQKRQQQWPFTKIDSSHRKTKTKRYDCITLIFDRLADMYEHCTVNEIESRGPSLSSTYARQT